MTLRAPRPSAAPWPGVNLQAVTALALAMTLLDAASTWALITTGVAVEGNGLLAAIAVRYGLEAMLVVRVVFGAALVIALAGVITWSSVRTTAAVGPREATRRRFDAALARGAMVLVIAVLGALSIYHVTLLMKTFYLLV